MIDVLELEAEISSYYLLHSHDNDGVSSNICIYHDVHSKIGAYVVLNIIYMLYVRCAAFLCMCFALQ